MKQSIGYRELFVLGGGVRGTLHHPQRGGRGEARTSVGILLLNGLPATRAGRGDAAVEWAEAFAASGYPAFRIDLPGFGDSGGDPPADWLGTINQGRYGGDASRAMEELAARFGLSAFILMGHCAGAVTAIFAAALNRRCQGLVLIDPYFFAAEVERAPARQQLSQWAEQSRTGAVLRAAFGAMKRGCLALCRNRYPDHANIALLRRWKEIAPRPMPMLILRAPERKPQARRPGDFDLFDYVVGLAGRRSRVAVRTIDGANHTFSNPAGRQAVRAEVGAWLGEQFPRAMRAGCTDAPTTAELPAFAHMAGSHETGAE